MIEGAEPEEYEAVWISIPDIKKMINDGCWKGSLEEEEVLYNLKNNLYSKKYAKQVKKIIDYKG